MGNVSTFFKSIVAPALISLALYLLLHYLVLPLYRRHRARYSQYLPLSAPTASASTSLFCLPTFSSAADMMLLLLPSRWGERVWLRRQMPHHSRRVVNASSPRAGDDGDDDEELGEDLDFEIDDLEEDRNRRRRDGLSLSFDAAARVATHGRTRSSGGIGGERDRRFQTSRQREASSDRRLSRELEEGFADSSSDDDDADDDEEHERDRTRTAR